MKAIKELKTGRELYVGTKLIVADSMNKKEYCDFRGWKVPANEDPNEAGMLVESEAVGNPNVEGRLGYVSWSPMSVFPDAYKANGNFTLGSAIELAKRGFMIARAGWNGKGMWVIYNPGTDGKEIPMAEGSLYKNLGLDEIEILPHFDMYTINADGRRAMLCGWAASQSDMDANDWMVIDETFIDTEDLV